MGRFLVYTVVMGVPDVVMEPSIVSPQCDYRLYTDLPFDGRSRWQPTYLSIADLDPRRAQRYVKIYWEPTFDFYDYSLYLDSTVKLKVDPTLFLDYLQPGSDIMLFRHYRRDCLYDEAETVIERGLDDPVVVRNQVDGYRSLGYPPHNGLWAGTVVLRRHTSAMRDVSCAWWGEVRALSSRDQISLSYVLWRHGVKVTPFPSVIWWGNPWFEWVAHDSTNNRFRKEPCPSTALP
jgi:hypothetical protein